MSRRDSILVIRLSSMGDVLFALPAVEALVRSGIAERVSWLVEDRTASMLAGVPGLHETVVFPRSRPAQWARHAAALRARRDDVVIDLQCNLKSRLQRTLLRAPHKLGFDAPFAREGAERGLTQVVQPAPSVRHRVAAGLALVEALGVPVPAAPPRPRLTLAPDATARVQARLDRVPGSGPLVALHPGTSAFGQLKRWPPAAFGRLGDALRHELDARVVVTCGPGEEPLAEAVSAGMSAPATVLPPIPLDELSACLAAVDLCVAADSMPLHLANALGTAVVGLYGPKDPAVTGPWFDRSEVVRAAVGCSPCTLRRCGDPICMQWLEVEAVTAAARRLLHP